MRALSVPAAHQLWCAGVCSSTAAQQAPASLLLAATTTTTTATAATQPPPPPQQQLQQQHAMHHHTHQHHHEQHQPLPALTSLSLPSPHLFGGAGRRTFSASSSSSSDGIDGRIGADPDEVADLLEANIYRPTKAEREQQRQTAGARLLLTTRREALSLYREVLRYSNLFVWRDEHGRVWRDVIRSSARQEFDAARHEPDPELINRMIVTGRDAVQRTVQGFLNKRARIIDDEANRPQVPPL